MKKTVILVTLFLLGMQIKLCAASWSTTPIELPFPYRYQTDGISQPITLGSVSDGTGGMIVARVGITYPYQGYYYINKTLECQRISADGEVLWSNGILLDSAVSWWSSGSLGSDAYSGNSGAVLSDGNGGAIISYAGRLYRVDGDGQKLWGPVIFGNIWRLSPFSHVSDGAGGYYITWTGSGSGYPAMISRIDNKGSIVWSKTLAIGYTEEPPVAYSDGNGGVVVLWDRWIWTDSPYALIHAQRLNSNGDYMWGNDGIVFGNINLWQPLIISNNDGEAIVLWKKGNDTSIYGQRLSANGDLLWGSEGKAFANGASFRAVSDGSDGAILFWNEMISGDQNNLYMQHIDSKGDVTLTPNGLKIIDGLFERPQVIKSGNDIFLRSGTYYLANQIYKIDSSGQLLWQASFIDDWIYVSSQINPPTFVSDNSGNLIVAWEIYATANYAQRVNSDGTIGQSTTKAPTTLSAIDAACDNGGRISLNWALSPDDSTLSSGSKKVTAYNILRSTIAGGPYGAIGNVVAGVSSFIDTSAILGTTYYYVVRSTDGTKESSDSNESSAVSARNLSVPPINLAAGDTPYDIGGSISLAWTKSEDDGTGLNNVQSYNIYRYSSSYGDIGFLVSVPAGSVGYVDKTTIDTDTYYYFIKALDIHCNIESQPSTVASEQSVNNFNALPGFIGSLPGIEPQNVNSLTSKSENAIAAFNAGNVTDAVGLLNDLLNEINAQTGKKIELSTAEILNTYVRNLINYINSR